LDIYHHVLQPVLVRSGCWVRAPLIAQCLPEVPVPPWLAASLAYDPVAELFKWLWRLLTNRFKGAPKPASSSGSSEPGPPDGVARTGGHAKVAAADLHPALGA